MDMNRRRSRGPSAAWSSRSGVAPCTSILPLKRCEPAGWAQTPPKRFAAEDKYTNMRYPVDVTSPGATLYQDYGNVAPTFRRFRQHSERPDSAKPGKGASFSRKWMPNCLHGACDPSLDGCMAMQDDSEASPQFAWAPKCDAAEALGNRRVYLDATDSGLKRRSTRTAGGAVLGGKQDAWGSSIGSGSPALGSSSSCAGVPYLVGQQKLPLLGSSSSSAAASSSSSSGSASASMAPGVQGVQLPHATSCAQTPLHASSAGPVAGYSLGTAGSFSSGPSIPKGGARPETFGVADASPSSKRAHDSRVAAAAASGAGSGPDHAARLVARMRYAANSTIKSSLRAKSGRNGNRRGTLRTSGTPTTKRPTRRSSALPGSAGPPIGCKRSYAQMAAASGIAVGVSPPATAVEGLMATPASDAASSSSGVTGTPGYAPVPSSSKRRRDVTYGKEERSSIPSGIAGSSAAGKEGAPPRFTAPEPTPWSVDDGAMIDGTAAEVACGPATMAFDVDVTLNPRTGKGAARRAPGRSWGSKRSSEGSGRWAGGRSSSKSTSWIDGALGLDGDMRLPRQRAQAGMQDDEDARSDGLDSELEEALGRLSVGGQSDDAGFHDSESPSIDTSQAHHGAGTRSASPSPMEWHSAGASSTAAFGSGRATTSPSIEAGAWAHRPDIEDMQQGYYYSYKPSSSRAIPGSAEGDASWDRNDAALDAARAGGRGAACPSAAATGIPGPVVVRLRASVPGKPARALCILRFEAGSLNADGYRAQAPGMWGDSASSFSSRDGGYSGYSASSGAGSDGRGYAWVSGSSNSNPGELIRSFTVRLAPEQLRSLRLLAVASSSPGSPTGTAATASVSVERGPPKLPTVAVLKALSLAAWGGWERHTGGQAPKQASSMGPLRPGEVDRSGVYRNQDGSGVWDQQNPRARLRSLLRGIEQMLPRVWRYPMADVLLGTDWRAALGTKFGVDGVRAGMRQFDRLLLPAAPQERVPRPLSLEGGRRPGVRHTRRRVWGAKADDSGSIKSSGSAGFGCEEADQVSDDEDDAALRAGVGRKRGRAQAHGSRFWQAFGGQGFANGGSVEGRRAFRPATRLQRKRGAVAMEPSEDGEDAGDMESLDSHSDYRGRNASPLDSKKGALIVQGTGERPSFATVGSTKTTACSGDGSVATSDSEGDDGILAMPQFAGYMDVGTMPADFSRVPDSSSYFAWAPGFASRDSPYAGWGNGWPSASTSSWGGAVSEAEGQRSANAYSQDGLQFELLSSELDPKDASVGW